MNHTKRECTLEPLFIADLHIGHEMAQRERGFKTQQKHDVAVMCAAFSRVAKKGTVVIAGDVLFCSEKYFDALLEEVVKALFPRWNPGDRLPFNIRIVLGNHDAVKRLSKSKYLNMDTFSAMREYRKDGKRIIITHIPIHPSELKPLGRWDINVHGHLHADTLLGPYYNVSYEQHNKAPTLNELLALPAKDTTPYQAVNQQNNDVVVTHDNGR